MKFIKGARTWRSILGTQTFFWPLTPPPPRYSINQPLSKGLAPAHPVSLHAKLLPIDSARAHSLSQRVLVLNSTGMPPTASLEQSPGDDDEGCTQRSNPFSPAACAGASENPFPGSGRRPVTRPSHPPLVCT